MSLTLRVLAPDQSVFDGSADEVILPSTTGQVGILPGHVSLLAALDVGVLRVRASPKETRPKKKDEATHTHKHKRTYWT